MREEKYNLLVGKISSQYTDSDTLLGKFYNQLESGKIQVDNHPPYSSPTACLNWGTTYKIYDCLYDYEPLTLSEIVPLIDNEKPEGMVNFILERMSDIGITTPLNHENLTSGDLSKKGLSILPILFQLKKWGLQNQ